MAVPCTVVLELQCWPSPRCSANPPLPQFGAGYVLTRLAVLRTAGSKEQREERCRMLALLGHLLKLQVGHACGQGEQMC